MEGKVRKPRSDLGGTHKMAKKLRQPRSDKGGFHNYRICPRCGRYHWSKRVCPTGMSALDRWAEEQGMKPPTCRQCGQEHWTTQPCTARGAPRASGLQEQLGAAERAPQSKGGPRSHDRKPAPPKYDPAPALEVRIDELEAEVKQLKRALAEANLKLAERVTEKAVTKMPSVTKSSVTKSAGVTKRRGRPPVGDQAESAAERMRKMRAAKAAAKAAMRKVATNRMDFQG